MIQPIVFPSMSDQQQAAFYAHYRAVEKDEVVGVLLAVFLGGFGAHHFYLRRPGTGVLFLLFSWTGVTYLIGWIEAFFMPGRVRRFNQEMASYLATAVVSGSYPVPAIAGAALAQTTLCPACGNSTAAVARFCGRCGASLQPA